MSQSSLGCVNYTLIKVQLEKLLKKIIELWCIEAPSPICGHEEDFIHPET